MKNTWLVSVRSRRYCCFGAIVLVLIPTFACPAPAEPREEGVGRTPPRVSWVDGEVSFWRPGADDWSVAQANTPLAPGDHLYTGGGGNVELQIGSRAWVRMAEDTQVGLENQEPDFLQIRVGGGQTSIDVRKLAAGHTIELNTPHAAFRIEHLGYYRARVDAETTTFIVRRGGRAVMISGAGDEASIEANRQVVLRGADAVSAETLAAPELDEWDRWNYDRTDRLATTNSSRYIADDIYGADELDAHGDWRVEPEYGAVWVPRRVAVGWAPYTDGRWIWDPFYGWTWLSDLRWGWAPFHYGRWVYMNDCWGWAPGPRVSVVAYAPALVAFVGGGFGFRFGVSAPVGWVSLSWGEPLYPWWGPAGFYGSAWWGGWGGPRVVNKIKVVNKINIVKVDDYRNARHRNGVVVVRGDRFGRGDVRGGRIEEFDRHRMRPVRGNPQRWVHAESLRPHGKSARRPPRNVGERPVVATRAPNDASERLRAAGLNPPSRDRRATRLVHGPRRPRNARIASVGESLRTARVPAGDEVLPSRQPHAAPPPWRPSVRSRNTPADPPGRDRRAKPPDGPRVTSSPGHEPAWVHREGRNAPPPVTRRRSVPPAAQRLHARPQRSRPAPPDRADRPMRTDEKRHRFEGERRQSRRQARVERSIPRGGGESRGERRGSRKFESSR